MDLEPDINDHVQADRDGEHFENDRKRFKDSGPRVIAVDGPAHGLAEHAPEVTQAHGAKGPKQWAWNGDFYYGAPETRQAVEAGVYRAGAAPNIGFLLVPMKLKIDKLIELPDDAGKQLLAEFDTFWKRGDAFKQFGMLHKRGLLMWGPPGSGKTSTLQLMMARIVRAGGIVLYVDNPSIGAGCLQLIRKVEPDRPLVVIFEDIDAIINGHGEHEILSILDGEAQIDKVVYVATTNYPERLDKRIVNRPSRFDTIKFIGMPTADARRMYLKDRAPDLADATIDDWVARSDGLSLAHLREMIIAVHCFEQSIDDVIKRLKGMRKPIGSAQYDDRPVGGFLTQLQ